MVGKSRHNRVRSQLRNANGRKLHASQIDSKTTREEIGLYTWYPPCSHARAECMPLIAARADEFRVVPRDHNRDFAFDLAIGELSRPDRLRISARDALELLGQLDAHGRATVCQATSRATARVLATRKGDSKSTSVCGRSFSSSKKRRMAPRLARGIAFEGVARRGQPGEQQRDRHGRGPGNDCELQPTLHGQPDEPVARIADARIAAVRAERHGVARLQQLARAARRPCFSVCSR